MSLPKFLLSIVGNEPGFLIPEGVPETNLSAVWAVLISMGIFLAALIRQRKIRCKGCTECLSNPQLPTPPSPNSLVPGPEQLLSLDFAVLRQ